MTATAAAALLLLTACGGGSDDSDQPRTAQATPQSGVMTTQAVDVAAADVAAASSGDAADAAASGSPDPMLAAPREDEGRKRALATAAVTYNWANWVSFRSGKFQPYLQEVASAETLKVYEDYRKEVPSAPKYTQTQIKVFEYIAEEINLKLSTAANQGIKTAYAKLPETIANRVRQGTSLTGGSAAGYDATEFTGWATYLSGTADADHNRIKQSFQEVYRQISLYLEIAGGNAYTLWTGAGTRNEAADDSRRLFWWGTNANSTDTTTLENAAIWPLKDYYIIPKLGNLRKVVEREDHKPRYSNLLVRLITLDPATFESKVLHGNVSTVKEPVYKNATETITPNTYLLKETDQLAAIAHYVNKDIDTNGAFDGMTVDQSRKLLSNTSIFMAKETGAPYQSYYVAQFIIRGINQMTIAAARNSLSSAGYQRLTAVTGRIDLARLAREYDAFVNNNTAMSDLTVDQFVNLGRYTMAIGAEATLSFALAMHVYERALDFYNKNPNSSLADHGKAVWNNVTSGWSGLNYATTLNALGFLNYGAGLSGSETNAAKIRYFVGGTFAANDIVSATGDIITVVRSNNTWAAKSGLLLAASARFVGAGWSGAEYIYRWWTSDVTGVVKYPAIVVNTYTALVANVGYWFSAYAAAKLPPFN